jgi:membrane protease YdiL (CAAX protease family)
MATANFCRLLIVNCELQAPPPPRPPVAPLERAAAAFEVILCSGFPTQVIVVGALAAAGMHPRTPAGELSAPFVFALTLLDTILVVGLITFFFRARGESIRGQLFGSGQTARDIVIGLALIPASWLLVVFVLLLLQKMAPALHNVPHNPLADLVKTPVDAVVFALVVMIAGGVREEIQRGFALRRFQEYLGGGAAGLVVFSALFALGHLEQGHDVALATGILGAFWGVVFLVRRSILGPMIGHAGFDLAQLVSFLAAAR